MKMDIKDSYGKVVGWSEDYPQEIRYFGFTQGYIGRYDLVAKRWYWMKGPKIGQFGPMGDIGYSAVLEAERAR